MPAELTWDLGTAYDFFISLDVLHEPANYGVRGVWAAGMRSRLPAAERDFLEEIMGTVVHGPPMGWLYELAPPKDAATVLRSLEKIDAAQRLPAVQLHENGDDPMRDVLVAVAERGSYDEDDVEAYREAWNEAHSGKKGKRITSKEINALLGWWARAEEFGERWLKALTTYYEVFFAEEERRIYPYLQDALEDAREMAEDMPVPDLVEELSQGIAFSGLDTLTELYLAPSFWSAPLVYFHYFDDDQLFILFGARPDDASLVPGEVVPDTLVRALKALSDPTRLKIMHYLAHDSLTPTQLAHKLRLRAPTVVHHLKTLRVAGLVQVTIAEGKEKSYAMRAGSVSNACDVLHRFLDMDEVTG